jgi:hypothetical protein
MDTPKWEPGELNSRQVEQVTVSAITDLWTDSYRRDQSEVARLNTFCQILESHARAATGHPIKVKP